MAANTSYSGWTYTDLQDRYERAQLLANNCTQDFAGNYFFPSDRSPRGFWTTTRRQRLDYVCDCPDFSRLIDQQITNFAPSRWVRGDWSTNPDNRILVNRCLHCLAVAIAEKELDPNFPINRIYTSRRSRSPKSNCGCGCGGSGDCGCDSKVLDIPEPRLIQGCETECYVEPLTPRTQRTPSTTEGIPAYQTFAIPTIEFAETRYQGCFGDAITIRLRRSTSLGFNNATVVGLPTNVEFSFEPERTTASQQVVLDFFGPGIYTVGIGAIAVGNFGDLLEAQIEILDCGNDLDNIDCPSQGFVDFSGGYCEGSYYVAFRQTGDKNPDGSCEILKVLDFREGLDCPFPDDPPQECDKTDPIDCTPDRLDEPICIETELADGFNSNQGFNAVVKVRTGRRITRRKPKSKECLEYCKKKKSDRIPRKSKCEPCDHDCDEECEVVERLINTPSCPPRKRKPVPAPTCGYAKRYIGWEKFDPSTGSYRNLQTGADNSSSVGTAIVETFSCSDGTIYGLRAFTARCVPPSNRVLDDFAAANYQGNEFGEGCCPFDETKPDRPECPPPAITKYSCSGGVCSADPDGSYNSLAECQAALVPPSFTGGQCEGVIYDIYLSYDIYIDGIFLTSVVRNGPFSRSGKVVSIQSPQGQGTQTVSSELVWTGGSQNVFLVTGSPGPARSVQNFSSSVERPDGLPDNCGDAPSSCP